MPKILLLAVFAASVLFAKENVPTEEFSHAALAMEGGVLYLLDDASQGFEDSYYGLLELDYSFFRNWVGIVQFGYSYLPTKSGVSYDGTHMAIGRVSLDYPIPFIKPVLVGAGFSCIWMRAEGGDLSKTTLEDNESEFGFFARLNLPIISTQKWRLGAKVSFERLWPAPETSETVLFGFYIQRQIW